MVPVVDVNIAVYNQAPFLRQTIDSVLSQRTTFPFRILIGDDCSTDGSIDILKEYESKYPTRIKVIYQPKNIGLDSIERNGIILLNNSTARYIALLDGDDYWTDPQKLQKQVDALEANPQYNMACHLGVNFIETTGETSIQPFLRSEIGFEDFAARGCTVHTMSVLYRNLPEVLDVMKKPWTQGLSGADLLLFFLLTLDGKKAFCFKEVMGVYRIHGGGTWSSSNYRQRAERAIKNGLLYKKHLSLSFRQKMYVNWFIKNALVNILYINNRGARFYVNKVINRGLFIFGPGIFSGLMAEIFYRSTKKRWNLPSY